MQQHEFARSELGTLGIELEIQLLDSETLDLKPCAAELLAQREDCDMPHFKQEVTCSMLEINSSIHHDTAELAAELQQLARRLQQLAAACSAIPCGGGTHPFQDWRQRQISDKPRYHAFAEQYGYLARQFTVFGQHIHIGCPDGDTAIWLCHALGYYIPHLIALSAASPFVQGEATAFASSRSNTVLAFPNSGHLPGNIKNWPDFQALAAQLSSCGVIQSLKDLYWDIRPKPEYGTVELRIFDTPYQVVRAVELAAVTQALALFLAGTRPMLPGREALYSVYGYNRFQAARFGSDAEFIDVRRGQRYPLRDSLLQLLSDVAPYAASQHAADCLLRLQQAIEHEELDYQRAMRLAAQQQDLRLLQQQLAADWVVPPDA
ncbi:YbdK family carboxylate-amine ligase [Vogesella facilis]|uniref:Putative glutamate--cysteine ligase 2 n=1 Tax=Vogesella facilis TaxID=1655232 RepID=A0ABV7RCP9_9NEIS